MKTHRCQLLCSTCRNTFRASVVASTHGRAIPLCPRCGTDTAIILRTVSTEDPTDIFRRHDPSYPDE